MGEKGFWLGRVNQLAVEDAIIQRFFAIAVACDHQTLFSRVPQRDRKHPVDMIDKIVAILLV